MYAQELAMKVLGYQNPNVVSRYALEQGISFDEAEKHFQECKKFLYACSVSSKPLRPSKQLDEIWHCFVLSTKDYADFCQQYLNGFIHHVPDEINTKRSATESRSDFEYSRLLVESIFGQIYAPVWYKTKATTKKFEEVKVGDCSSICGGSGLNSEILIEAANCGGCSGLDGNCTGCSSN